MRKITTHHDGHGLNESIEIKADEPGPGGASHTYEISINIAENPANEVMMDLFDVQFQKGPRNEKGSTPGMTDIALLSIVRDRLESFQAGEFACGENAQALELIQQAMYWMKERADARAKRGVLGTYQK